MEPLSALSLAAAVAQLVDYGFKILGNVREISSSLSGATEENQSLENATRVMQRLTEMLASSKLGSLPDEQDILSDLVAECLSLSDQLLALLDKIKAKDLKSKIQLTLAAVKSKRYEKEKLRLQKRLEDCQLRLDRYLTALSRNEIKEQLEYLIMSDKRKPHELTTILRHAEEFRNGADLTCISPRVRDQLQDLLGLSQSIQTKRTQQKILRFLSFPEMRQRIGGVTEAHKETFRWIFDDATDTGPVDDSSSDDARVTGLDQTAREKADAFVEWLSSGTGVYHIAGKLGSGKSTLMKYLCGHARVREELEKWAGSSELVAASFFFWRAGSPLQRSLLGLFRSLLYDILQQRPDLIPEVLPDLWNQAAASPIWEPPDSGFENGLVQPAFSRLLKCAALYESTSFCFFIDGLDEYEETLQDDYKALVQLLFSWTQAAPHAVKLCVSSREYNVFLNFFRPDQRLRLQDLTLADMRCYVRDRLQDLDQAELGRLVDVITEKANGIFLWVALVVKSIRGRLEDGYRVSLIEEEVNLLPDELEGLFLHLLNSISKSYLKAAYQTFAILQLGQGYRTGRVFLSLLAYSFLDEYDVDPEFAQKPHDFPLAPLTGTTRLQRETTARKRLNATCKGLVEADRTEYMYLTYTHRSVVEFLEKHLRLTDAAKSILAGFDAAHALSQLVLAELRSLPRNMYWIIEDIDNRPHLSSVIQSVVEVRLRNGLDSHPYLFLEALRSAVKAAVPEHDDEGGELQGRYPKAQQLGRWWDMRSAVLIRCAIFGMVDYLDRVTKTDPSTIDDNDKLATLAWFSTFYQHRRVSWTSGNTTSTISFGGISVLLGRGVSPDAAIHTNPWTENAGIGWGTTFWEHFVQCIVAFTPANEAMSRAGSAIQQFLEHGASSDIRIALEGWDPMRTSCPTPVVNLDPERTWSVERWKHQASGPHPRLPSKRGGIARPMVKFSFRKDFGAPKVMLHDRLARVSNESEYGDREIGYYSFVASKGGEISFEDFIEFHNYENKDIIFELCRRQKRAPVASTTSTLVTDGEVDRPGGSDNDKEEENRELGQAASTPPTTDDESTQEMAEKTNTATVNGLLPKEEVQPRNWYPWERTSLFVHVMLGVLAALVLSQMVVKLIW